jgi:mannitol-specific phosphotransferase system IIBC component
MIGSSIIWGASWTPHRGIPLFGYYLLPTFGAPYVLLLALSSQNVSGSTKKSISTGSIFIGYNVGNIIAPYTVFTDEKLLKYKSTWISILVAMGVTILLSLWLRFILIKENRKRDKEEREQRRESVMVENKDQIEKGDDLVQDDEELEEKIEREDLTDWENKKFRYSL